MIRALSGTVLDWRPPEAVIDVSGVGYLVHTNRRLDQLTLGETVFFHTYLAVRENALDLYGFATRDELAVFLHLITLPKIGPKTALQILSQADIALIKESVQNDDPVRLSKLSGIGKKSAENIVSGLRNKLSDEELATGFRPDLSGVPDHVTDTIDALISLGYPASDARRVMVEVHTNHPALNSSADTLKIALKLLNSL